MLEYRIVVQTKNESGRFVNDEVISDGEIEKPETIMDIGLRHAHQIELLQKIQDYILDKQSTYLKEDINFCPKCGNKLRKNGVNKCSFNSVFTDHKVPVQRQICPKCKWSSVPSVNSLFGTHMHPDLMKLQCEESVRQSYAKASESLNRKSCKTRAVNSTMTMYGVVDQIGNHIGQLSLNDELTKEPESAEDLIIQVDGGHLKSKDKNKRSFEAMTSISYKPENVIRNQFTERGTISKKHSAASALEDNQLHIKKATLNAAKKEGLTSDTIITALCDGADNCWNVINYLEPYCKSITKILDWFHISMKFKNIGQFKQQDQAELLEGAKWSVWHGNVKLFNERIDKLVKLINDDTKITKLIKLKNYINNNSDIANPRKFH